MSGARRRSPSPELAQLLAVPPLPLLGEEQLRRQAIILARMERATGICAWCGDGLPKAAEGSPQRVKDQGRIYCSQRCMLLGNGQKAREQRAIKRQADTKTCKGCHQPFERHPRESLKHFERRVTCGRLCPNPGAAARVRSRAIRLACRARRDAQLSHGDHQHEQGED